MVWVCCGCGWIVLIVHLGGDFKRFINDSIQKIQHGLSLVTIIERLFTVRVEDFQPVLSETPKGLIRE